MKILLAPDSFKEGLRAIDVATAIEQGLRMVLPDVECIKLPMADGGDGMLDALMFALGGRRIRKTVMGPLGEPLRAAYGLLEDGNTAVVEMAAASGLHLVPANRRNPLKTTSFGTGELIGAALKRGARRIIVGLGGSATNDCGVGMAQALGIRFFDKAGVALTDGATGGSLSRVHRVDWEARLPALAESEILIAYDVRNSLVGKYGASATYGPQKGASEAQVKQLDRNLRHIGKLLERELGVSLLSLTGAGAAGGLGAGLVAFADGRLREGAELVAELVGLRHQIDLADLVITGEGRVDSQTNFGKTAAGVAQIAGHLSVPVVAVGGALADNANKVFEQGIDALDSATVQPMDLASAIEGSRRNLRRTGERIGRWLIIGQKLSNK